MKFIHADHALDLDGMTVTVGVTRDGDVWISDLYRLSPDMAVALAINLRENAAIARRQVGLDAMAPLTVSTNDQ